MEKELEFCKGCGQYVKYCICKQLEDALKKMKKMEEDRLRREYQREKKDDKK